MNKEGPQTNVPKDKEIDDHVIGLTPERCHRLFLPRKKEEKNSPALEIA